MFIVCIKYFCNGANKTKYCKHLLKTAALPPIEAYLAVSKIQKFTIFERSKILAIIFFLTFQGSKFYSITNYKKKCRMMFFGVF